MIPRQRKRRLVREEKKVVITFTKAELWELSNNFSASFESGTPENALADRISDKLSRAMEKLEKMT